MITAFNEQVKNYLRRAGRSQQWLRNKLYDKGYPLASSTLCQKLKGDRGFKESEISAIKTIMSKYKL